MPLIFFCSTPAVYAENLHVADLDRNGGISISEAETYFSGIFYRLDQDGDELLSASEFLRAYNSIGRRYRIDGFKALIRQFDQNWDDLLSLEEYMPVAMQQYWAADLNRDGHVTAVEAANL